MASTNDNRQSARSKSTKSQGKGDDKTPIPFFFAHPPEVLYHKSVLDKLGLKNLDRDVLAVILIHARRKGWADMAHETIAEILGVTRRAVLRSYARLKAQKAGLIRVDEVAWRSDNKTCRRITALFWDDPSILPDFPNGQPSAVNLKVVSAGESDGVESQARVTPGSHVNKTTCDPESQARVTPGSADRTSGSHKADSEYQTDPDDNSTPLYFGAPSVALCDDDAPGPERTRSSNDVQRARSGPLLDGLERRSRLDSAVSCWPLVDGCDSGLVDRAFKAISDFITKWTDASKRDMGNVIGEAVATLGLERGEDVVMYGVDVLRNDEKRGRQQPDIVLPYFAGIVMNKLDAGGLKATERVWKKPKGAGNKRRSAKAKADPTPPEDRRPPANDHHADAPARRVSPDLDPDDADGYEPFNSRPEDHIEPPRDRPAPPLATSPSKTTHHRPASRPVERPNETGGERGGAGGVGYKDLFHTDSQKAKAGADVFAIREAYREGGLQLSKSQEHIVTEFAHWLAPLYEAAYGTRDSAPMLARTMRAAWRNEVPTSKGAIKLTLDRLRAAGLDMSPADPRLGKNSTAAVHGLSSWELDDFAKLAAKAWQSKTASDRKACAAFLAAKVPGVTVNKVDYVLLLAWAYGQARDDRRTGDTARRLTQAGVELRKVEGYESSRF